MAQNCLFAAKLTQSCMKTISKERLDDVGSTEKRTKEKELEHFIL